MWKIKIKIKKNVGENSYGKESLPPHSAKHQTLRIAVEKHWLFFYEWQRQGEWELMLNSLNSPMAYRLQILKDEITGQCGWGVWSTAGSWLVWSEVRVNESFLLVLRTLWGLFQLPGTNDFAKYISTFFMQQVLQW